MRVYLVCLHVDGPINRVVWGEGGLTMESLRYLYDYLYVGYVFELRFLARTI